MTLKTALLAGSTGLIGREVLELLLNDENYREVISIVRKTSGVKHAKLREIVVDFGTLSSSLQGCKADVVFCCIGTTMAKAGSQENFRKVDYDIPVNLAKWSEQNKVSGFYLVSALGASSKSGIFYNKVKGEVEDFISTTSIPHIVFFRPSLLLGDRTEKRPGEKAAILFAKLFSFLFIGPLRRYKSIHVKTVAKAMVKKAAVSVKGVEVVENEQISTLANLLIEAYY